MRKFYICILVPILTFALVSLACSQKKEQSSAEKIAHKLKQHLPRIENVITSDQKSEKISGHYSDFGPQMKKRLDGTLSGEDLFIFTDATYIYTRWADVLPQTIYEKGTWQINNGFLKLKSDGSLKNTDFPKDHQYLILTFDTDKIPFLMGHSWDFSYFSEHVGKDPLFTFLLCSLERVKRFDQKDGAAIKKELIKKAWHPGLFEK